MKLSESIKLNFYSICKSLALKFFAVTRHIERRGVGHHFEEFQAGLFTRLFYYSPDSPIHMVEFVPSTYRCL